MSKVCLYLQIHQPWRTGVLSVPEVGTGKEYFEAAAMNDLDNQKVLKKVAEKSYRPMLSLLEKLLKEQPDFKVSLSITGVALEQMEKYTPDVIAQLKRLAYSDRVEFLAETYYHSLASLYSPIEFTEQVHAHKNLMESLFSKTPRVFRNTELVYTNNVAEQVADMGFIGMLAEGADKILKGRKQTKLYSSPNGLPILLKHYQLSDDVAFRFSETSRTNMPLTADTYCHWINSSFGENDLVNLFMDFETFGEHQWVDTGIFNFFYHFVRRFLSKKGQFVTPTEAILGSHPEDIFDSVDPVSWADTDRDITAWRGNPMQHDTLNKIYKIGNRVLHTGDKKLISDWRRLQTSDHFYYMCTKWSSDGDVHAYFSPFKSPHTAYSNYNNILADLNLRLATIENNG